ncbi:hypothetical protein A0H81_02835 [Grifola frondosa]|uniref:Uncharacterized protein n=1 Tax=Grifola frondosa TaxID=5627 RepID=A0A1C7MLZ2_GRIFR|nr:hypothetical protein A0H81_02835 [Grifola frondosa]
MFPTLHEDPISFIEDALMLFHTVDEQDVMSGMRVWSGILVYVARDNLALLDFVDLGPPIQDAEDVHRVMIGALERMLELIQMDTPQQLMVARAVAGVGHWWNEHMDDARMDPVNSDEEMEPQENEWQTMRAERDEWKARPTVPPPIPHLFRISSHVWSSRLWLSV